MFRNSSPGKLTYITSLFVHGRALLRPSPKAIPKTTPAKVATVMMFPPRHLATGCLSFLEGVSSILSEIGKTSSSSGLCCLLCPLAGIWTEVEDVPFVLDGSVRGASGDSWRK
ncbi:hypothetical protein AVEN_225510-1 [Araneus ventricosus]|uniref:Uncharacterized protein n=1 Tax=Araneus ventricosus TaxID=182803 RepID=A0A4Y2PLG4_ARAVE|nr:hypothetical protein AVEN_254605-1 [Araneus ventricosus]GBN51047.1 hypothetical protein AVEN_225510-1 [Araneus ventricosus]